MTRYSRKALVLQSVKFIDNSFFQILFFTKLDDQGFPGGTSGTEPACQCRRGKRCGFHPWAGKTPGGGPGNPLQWSCLENLMDRGAWRAAAHGFTQSRTQLKRLSTHKPDDKDWPSLSPQSKYVAQLVFLTSSHILENLAFSPMLYQQYAK